MGIAKTMHAIGVYHFYTNDYVAFVAEIGNRFKVNIEARFEDYTLDDMSLEKENEVFNFGFEETYYLTIFTEHYDDELYPKKFSVYNFYDLHIPIQTENEKILTLEFWPNGVTQLRYLPFSNKWQFFIDDLQGINDLYYHSHLEIVEFVLLVRNHMIAIMHKIDCNEVIIWTDADYKTEEEYVYTQYVDRTTTFEELKEAAFQLDGIHLFDFMQVVNQEVKIDSNIYSDLQIAFIDKF